MIPYRMINVFFSVYVAHFAQKLLTAFLREELLCYFLLFPVLLMIYLSLDVLY